jgi:hypothetical protein
MKASDTPKSAWQHYVEDVWAWYASFAAMMPECPMLRELTASVLHVQSDILKGALRVTEYLLTRLEPPKPPRSEHIPIE